MRLRKNRVAVQSFGHLPRASARHDGADAGQPDGISAHDARLNAGIQCAPGQIKRVQAHECCTECLDFSVRSNVTSSMHSLNSLRDNLITAHNQRTHRTILRPNCLTRQLDTAPDVMLVPNLIRHSSVSAFLKDTSPFAHRFSISPFGLSRKLANNGTPGDPAA